jgi:hypothetical protein
MEHLSIGQVNPIDRLVRLATIGVSPIMTTSSLIFCCRHVPHFGFIETWTLTNVQRTFSHPDYPTPSANAKPCNRCRNVLPDLARTDAPKSEGYPATIPLSPFHFPTSPACRPPPFIFCPGRPGSILPDTVALNVRITLF